MHSVFVYFRKLYFIILYIPCSEYIEGISVDQMCIQNVKLMFTDKCTLFLLMILDMKNEYLKK